MSEKKRRVTQRERDAAWAGFMTGVSWARGPVGAVSEDEASTVAEEYAARYGSLPSGNLSLGEPPRA